MLYELTPCSRRRIVINWSVCFVIVWRARTLRYHSMKRLKEAC